MRESDYFVVQHLREFTEHALTSAVKPGARVADIGCGEQPWRRLIESLGGTYTGVDVAQNALSSVDIIASVVDIPREDSSFDVVLCTEVLEHVADSAAAFAELARLLAPGGVLILTTPFMYPLHEEPRDFLRFTPHLLRTLAEAAGLRIESLAKAGNEIEVLATVWGTAWTRFGEIGTASRIACRLMILAANVLARAGSSLARRHVQQKSYLTTLCIMRK